LINCGADKMPVGKSPRENESFTLREIELQKNDIIYTLTDGLPDQFGGPNGKKYKYKQLEALLLGSSMISMSEQRVAISDSFVKWKGALEQVDDVLIIGIKI